MNYRLIKELVFRKVHLKGNFGFEVKQTMTNSKNIIEYRSVDLLFHGLEEQLLQI